jgi:hypothetical protein
MRVQLLRACVLVMAAGAAVAADKPKETTFTVAKPVGKWVRDVKLKGQTCQLVLDVADDRLSLTADLKVGETSGAVRIDADYGMNKQSCLFGVLASVDVSHPRIDATASELQALAGQPFAVRFRVDDGVLTLTELKGFGVAAGDEPKDVLAVFCGRYLSVEAKQKELLNQSEGPAPMPQRVHGGILKADPPKEGGELKQAKAEEVADDAAECEPPSDAEVMRAFNARQLRDVGKDFEKRQDDITIVKNLISSRADGPRYHPLVGFACTHHCLWECTVYYRDPVVLKAKREVVCLDVDRLRACRPTPAVVPTRMPER